MVGCGEAAPEGVGHQFFSKSSGEVDFSAGKVFAQVGESVESDFAGEFSDVVNGEGSVFCSEAADGIEIFKRESVSVEGAVTRCAGGVGAMLSEAFAHSGCGDGLFCVVENAHIWGWRRGWSAEDLLHDELASLDGRSSVWVAGDAEDCSHSEEATAVLGGDIDSAEILVEIAGDSVMLGEAMIEKCELAVDEFGYGTVLDEHVSEVEIDFLTEIIFELLVEGGEKFGIGIMLFETADLEPLSAEIG